MPEDQIKEKTAKITPEIVNDAIEQAEAEAAAEAKELVDMDVDRMLPDGEFRVGSHTAHKMSFARATIIVKALGLDGEDDDKEGTLAENLEAVQVAVYVLFESSITTLHGLSQKPGALLERAMEFCDNADEGQYSKMVAYASKKMADLGAAERIGTAPSNGMPDAPEAQGDEEDRAEKN